MGKIVGFSRGAPVAARDMGLAKGQLGYLRHAVRATACLTGRPLEEVTRAVAARAGVGDLRDVSQPQMPEMVDFIYTLQRDRFRALPTGSTP